MPLRTATHQSHSLVINPELTQLTRVREFVARIVTQTVSCEHTLAEIELAITELVSNIIRHGFPAARAQSAIQIEVDVTDGKLLSLITHNGIPFQPETINEVREPQEGGMGLFLVQQCLDHVSYETSLHGTSQIRIQKSIC